MSKYTLTRSVVKPFLCIKNNIVKEVNYKLERLTGYSREELIGKSLSQISKMFRIDTQISLEDIETDCSCFLFTKELEPREVTITCNRIQTEIEHNYYYYIKEKRNSRIEDRISYVTSIFPDNEIGVAVYSILDGIILKLNEKFLTISNIQAKDIGNYIGKKFNEIIPKYNDTNIEDVFSNIIKNGKPYHAKESKSKSRIGDIYLDESFVPIYIFGKAKYIVHTAFDVTERVETRKKYEENLYLKAQYSTLSRIMENLELGLVRLSYPEYKIIDINYKAYNNFEEINNIKISYSDIIGERLSDVFREKIYIINELLENSIKYKSKSSNKIVKYNIESEEIYYEYILQPLYGLNDEIVEIIIIEIDVTEEEKAKNIMENAIRMQDEIYANVAHELRTPLNVIFSANQLMDILLKNQSLKASKEKFDSYNNNIKQNCYRLIKLINNIVDLSKINSKIFELNLRNENIVDIIENIVQSVLEYGNMRNLKIIFDTNVEEKIIACDPEKIERVILNLISNAIKFSNPNSEISVNVLDKGNTVEISVKDSGEGIEKVHLDHLFEKFYQVNTTLSRSAEGSGIGLSLIKSIVDLHEGNISVESELGKGSIFKVELPARIIDNPNSKINIDNMNSKIEMINIEFSDIYSND